MKKILLLLMIIVAVICITACNLIHTHNFGEWSVTKNHTCTEDGVKNRYCSCGEKQSEVIPAIKHNYVDGICSNCDDVMSSQCKHDDPTQIIVVNAVAPTCQKTGLTEGLKCLKCGTMVLPQAIVNTIECIESDWIIDKDSTNTEIGNKHTECTMCGKLFFSAIIVKESKGLDFALNDDKQSYSVTGIGICTDMDIAIPSSHNDLPVTSISNWVLNDCSFIRSVVIPASVTNIGDFALQICTSLKNIEVDSNNQYYKSIDGNLYTKDGKTLIQYATGKEETSFAIPDSVTSIGDYAFRDCPFITSIEIPDSVTSIGEFALCGCISLISIEIPKSVTSIGDGLFWHCTSLTNIEVDQNNQYYKSIDGNLYTKDGKTLIQYAIGKEATSFTIPDSVTSIVHFAFANGTSLTSVFIGNSVNNIDQSAFLNCTSLTLYCEANSKPIGWVYYWDNLDYFGGKVSVVWGYKGN